jgi:peptidyl-prolyl cis-trans isomerase C
MAYFVDGQLVTETLILEEQGRIARDPRWAQIKNEEERAKRLRAAAEHTAVERTVVEQAAMRDPRFIPPEVIEREVSKLKAGAGCRAAYDDAQMRIWVERDFRVQRKMAEMVAGAQKPSEADVRAFYEANRANFCSPEAFEAAHIVCNVNHEQSEEQARAAIETALAELECGEPFGVVADRRSDCKGNGGDLGKFPTGVMVPEFEEALRAIQPGGRTGVFRTPFGFHIAELRAWNRDSLAPFEDVREDIQRVLTMASEHGAYQQAARALALKARVVRTPDGTARAAGL